MKSKKKRIKKKRPNNSKTRIKEKNPGFIDSRVVFVGIITLILILFLLNFRTFAGLVGYVVQNFENTITFSFYDNASACILNGNIYVDNRLIGKTENGVFIMDKDSYFKNFSRNSNLTLKGLTDYCYNEDQELPFMRNWVMPDLTDSINEIDELIFETKLIPRMPVYYYEMQGFVRPEEVKEYLSDLSKYFKSNNSEDIVDKISNYRTNYRTDILLFNKLDYWQTPKETLDLGHGDCEDWAVTTLSLIRAYDSSLKCYNIVWQTHISIFCFIDGSYIIYDQKGIKHETRLRDEFSLLENKAILRKMRDDYFKDFGIRPNERNVYSVFNEKELIEFKDSEDMIDWELSLK